VFKGYREWNLRTKYGEEEVSSDFDCTFKSRRSLRAMKRGTGGGAENELAGAGPFKLKKKTQKGSANWRRGEVKIRR